MLPPRFVCMFSLLSLGRLSLWMSRSGDSMGTGEREAEKFLCQLPALSCVLHSSLCLQAAQNEMQQPGESTWEPFILLTCQTLGKDNDIR